MVIADEKRPFLSVIGDRFVEFSGTFARHFKNGSSNGSKRADQYVRTSGFRVAEVVRNAGDISIFKGKVFLLGFVDFRC